MSDRTRIALEFAAVLLVALLFTVIPGGGKTLDVMLAALSAGFFVALAVFGYRLYREQSFALEALTDLQRGVLYGCVGGAFVVFAARARLQHELGGGGTLLWLALLGACSYGLYWVWTSSRDYA